MAERVITQLIDDINGAEIDDGTGERLLFAVRGVEYQIDLSTANVAKFEKALKPFVESGKRIGGTRRRTKLSSDDGKSSKEQLAAIREWARGQGYEIADRGRINAEIRQAFDAAH